MVATLRLVLLVSLLGGVAEAQGTIWSVGGKRYRNLARITRLGDVNGDGTDDLATATDPAMRPRDLQFLRALDGRTGATIWELLNRSSSPTFGVDTLKSLRSDADGDGIVDLIVHHQIPVEVRIHSGADGHELLRRTTTYPYSPDVWVDAVGDVDGDGVSEVAICTTGAPLLVELLSGATLATIGTVTAPLPPTTKKWSNQLRAAGDFDGDGAPDAAVAVNDSTFAAIVVFSLADGHLVGQVPLDPALALIRWFEWLDDSDGDGRPELASLAMTGTTWPMKVELTIWSGATFAPMQTITSPFPGREDDFRLGPTLGDVDGDGIGDFLLGQHEFPRTDDAARPLFIRSGRTFEPLREVSDFIGWYEPIVGGSDLDGDGLGDLVSIGSIGEAFDRAAVVARRGETSFFSAWPRELKLPALANGPLAPTGGGGIGGAWDPQQLTARWLASGLAPGSIATLWLVSIDGVAVNAPLAHETANLDGTVLAEIPWVPDIPHRIELQAVGLDPLGNTLLFPIRVVEWDYYR
jgi:hypothetical protein